MRRTVSLSTCTPEAVGRRPAMTSSAPTMQSMNDAAGEASSGRSARLIEYAKWYALTTSPVLNRYALSPEFRVNV